MIGSLDTFAEWEKTRGAYADITGNGFDCHLHREFVPLSMHGPGPLYVDYEVTEERVDTTVDVGFRQTTIRSSASYESSTLHVPHPDASVDRDVFAVLLEHYEWECFPDVDGPDDVFEEDAEYAISAHLEYEPALDFTWADYSLAELERTRAEQPDSGSVEGAFDETTLAVGTWNATLSEVTDDGFGRFESADGDHRLVVGHDALPKVIPFVGTRYRMRTGIAAGDCSFVESSARSLSEWRGIVDRVDDGTATLSLTSSTEEADGDATLTVPVGQLPDGVGEPTDRVTVVVHWTYDGTRTDEGSVVPDSRTVPGTALAFAYDGRVSHDAGREIPFSNAIQYGYGHDGGAIVVFDSSEEGVDDPEVAVPDNRPVARIDESGELDWFIDAESDKSSVSIRDAVVCDDGLYTLNWGSPNARFDAATGRLLQRFD